MNGSLEHNKVTVLPYDSPFSEYTDVSIWAHAMVGEEMATLLSTRWLPQEKDKNIKKEKFVEGSFSEVSGKCFVFVLKETNMADATSFPFLLAANTDLDAEAAANNL